MKDTSVYKILTCFTMSLNIATQRKLCCMEIRFTKLTKWIFKQWLFRTTPLFIC